MSKKTEVARENRMNKKTSLLIGVFLLVIAVCFIGYAINHPEATLPWSNRVTFMLYGIYVWLLFKFLLDIPVLQQIRKTPLKGSLIRSIIYFFMAIVFLVMEISGETVDFYTFVRGFIVIGGVDVGIENLCLYVEQRKITR